MNLHHALALAALFAFALSAPAQQQASNTSTNTMSAAPSQRSPQEVVPSAAVQLKELTEKLDLTVDQQAQVKTILDALHDATQKLADDPNLTHQQRVERVWPLRFKARDQIYAAITDEQKQKFEAFMQQGPHPEMHGSLNGPPPQQQ